MSQYMRPLPATPPTSPGESSDIQDNLGIGQDVGIMLFELSRRIMDVSHWMDLSLQNAVLIAIPNLASSAKYEFKLSGNFHFTTMD